MPTKKYSIFDVAAEDEVCECTKTLIERRKKSKSKDTDISLNEQTFRINLKILWKVLALKRSQHRYHNYKSVYNLPENVINMHLFVLYKRKMDVSDWKKLFFCFAASFTSYEWAVVRIEYSTLFRFLFVFWIRKTFTFLLFILSHCNFLPILRLIRTLLEHAFSMG